MLLGLGFQFLSPWKAPCLPLKDFLKCRWQPIYFSAGTQIFTYSFASRKKVLKLKQILLNFLEACECQMQLATCRTFEQPWEKDILQIIKHHAESCHHLEFSREKSFHKVIAALEILYKWSVLLQLYWNKSTSSEITVDERITHIVYLSKANLLQPPGMKMNVPYVISRLQHGWRILGCVSGLKKTKVTLKRCQK